MTISIKAQIMRIINRILVIAICGLVLTINALAWLLWNLDVNPYRTQITAAIIKQTGWKVDLAGTVTHRMLTNGFRVVAKDIKIIDPTGQFVDVQELRANIALDSIFERYILVQNLEIDVRTCDIELRPEVNPPLPIVVTMEASSLHLTARDCHVYDSESTLDTQIKRLILDVAPIPILLDGWIVMGMPAGITTAKQSGHVTANSVDFGNILGLKELQLDFTNDHGVVSLSNLTTALQAPKPNTSGLLTSPLVTINGKVHLGFDEPLQTLFVTLWNGIDDVWLKPITITAGNLTVNNHNNPINLKDLKIDSAGLPLLVHGSNPIKWWLHPTTHSAIMVKRTTISGSAAFNSIANLTDYSINLDLSPGILEAAIQQGTLGIGLANNNLVNSIILDLNGNLRLLTQGPPPTKLLSTNSDIMPYNLKLDQFTLGIQQVEIATPSGPYNIGSGSLQIVDFPLITGTKPLPLIPEKLLPSVWPNQPSVKFAITNLVHNSATIKAIRLDMAVQEHNLVLQRFESEITDTKVLGKGTLKLDDVAMPWSLGLRSPGVDLDALLKVLGAPFPIQGKLSVDLDLKSFGLQFNTWISNLDGKLKLTGRNLNLLSMDLDAILSHLESSRGIGLVDVGAYILLGPAGILLTKGTQYSVLLGSFIERGSSKVTMLNTSLSIKTGVIKTEDVALLTDKHRVVLSGTMDMRENGPASLQIATVDPKGCAKYMESISGTGRNPEVSKSGVVIHSVLNPVQSVVGTIIEPVIGGCFIPFYQGVVPAVAN